MTSIWVLAQNTVRELTRNKLLYILVVFAVLLILASLLLARLTVGQWERIINNVGLATVQLSGALVAILVGVGLVAGEVDRRTVYVTLATPVTRAQFVFGRFLGLCATLALLVGVMGVAMAAVLGVAGYPMGFTGVSALLLIFVELCMLAGIAVVFSSFTTQTLGVTFSVALFVIGHLAGELTSFGEKIPGASGALVRGLARIVPNLDLLNLKSQAANMVPVDGRFVASSALYGLVWAGLSLLVASVIFSRRDLK